MEEPSVLDFLKSKLTPWRKSNLDLTIQASVEDEISEARITHAQQVGSDPQVEAEALTETQAKGLSEPAIETHEPEKPDKAAWHWPWRSLISLTLAIIAQITFLPGPDRAWALGVALLILSIGFLIWAYISGEIQPGPIPHQSDHIEPTSINLVNLLIGLIIGLVAFVSFGNLEFSIVNLTILLSSLIFTANAFWIQNDPNNKWSQRVALIFKPSQWHLTLSSSTLLAIAFLILVIFFRYYRIAQVPPEMNSDHAEKILDISRVLAGKNSIFFPNNGGREALQMYLVAGYQRLFNSNLDFTALKLVTITVGFLSLPFIYLLGKEFANLRVGIFAFIFAGVSYWPNVVSRVGLRLPFYILFTAATLYFLLRGIRLKRRNDFIFAGISLGLSLYGYSANRILPLVVLVAVCLYLIHTQSRNHRKATIISTAALVTVSFIIFLPLLRYILAEPDSFFFRTLSRMSDIERPLEGSLIEIFLNNTWRALTMFSWEAGEVWPISIPHYPALSVVPGGLFYIGAGLLFIRYAARHNWQDLFLLLSIPILMLPSILSLAFPAENPNLYRTGGALIPVFLMVGVALDSLLTSLSSRLPTPSGKRFAWIIAIILIIVTMYQDYDLVFNQYFQQYQRSAWNTSEMGSAARGFIQTGGAPENVYVMGYPHWVDTRLVAIHAGYPTRDFQLFVDQLAETQSDQNMKIFLLNPQDNEAQTALLQLYPNGWFSLYNSKVDTKDFLIFFVPPQVHNNES